jgi:hypothetical protein
VSVEAGSGRGLVACLAEMLSLLEQNDPVEAAALVGELNAAIASGPRPMTEADLSEARRLLAGCVEREKVLRRSTTEALQRLGATRRARAYRHP